MRVLNHLYNMNNRIKYSQMYNIFIVYLIRVKVNDWRQFSFGPYFDPPPPVKCLRIKSWLRARVQRIFIFQIAHTHTVLNTVDDKNPSFFN